MYFAPESRFSTEDIQLISETDRTWLVLFIVLLPLRSTRKEKLFMFL
nr:MAG TPA: DNA fragmentation factor alpha subunit [Caudoviricetes sp.]